MTRYNKILLLLKYVYYSCRGTEVRSSDIDNTTIITLTSYGPRLKWLPIVLTSLMRQNQQRKILLFLSKEEKLPLNLTRFITKHAELIKLVFTKDTRSYKKLLPIIQIDQILEKNQQLEIEGVVTNINTQGFVTVDDDIIYLKGSIDALTYDKNVINCTVAHRKKSGDPYNRWVSLPVGQYSPKEALSIGAGGVFYPITFIEFARAWKQTDLFQEYCAHQDDLWWNLIQQKQGIHINRLKSEIIKLDNLLRMPKLSSENLQSGNDQAIERLITRWNDFI